jgi:hypothetical protein
LAEAQGVVTRLLRLTLLTPEIVEAILDGRQSKGVQLEELTRAPSARKEQHRLDVRAIREIKTPTTHRSSRYGTHTVGFPNILRLALLISLTEGSRSKTMDACG